MQLPYLKLNELRGALDAPWFEKWIRGNTASAKYWRDIAYQTPQSYAKVKVPSLAVTGWFDADFSGSPMNYLAMKQYGATADARRPRLVIGPWQHIINQSRKLGAFDYGPKAMIDWDGYVCRWFDHYLKGIDNGVMNDPPVHVFVMGRNRWSRRAGLAAAADALDQVLPAQRRPGELDRWRWTLSTSPPPRRDNAAFDAYTYDPAKPTRSPFTGGHLEDGAADTRKSSSGPDVLVYTTPPLGRRGRSHRSDHGQALRRHLRPRHRLDGSAGRCAARRLLRDALRGRHARPSSRPETQRRFQSGQAQHHRAEPGLRIHASSSGGPRPTPSRRDIASASRFPAATSPTTCATSTPARTTSGWKRSPSWPSRSVFHTVEHPSHVVLPVIPRR